MGNGLHHHRRRDGGRFDATIVSIAVHDLTTDLHASLSTIQWVSTGYLLAMFVTFRVTGWSQTALGGKTLWLISLATFLLGSVLCAMSWDAPSLIVFRVVQGIGGGVMLPLMTTLIMQAAGGRNVGRVMAAITLPTTLGPILGPVIGGVILAVAGWRWLFFVNVPFCLLGLWLARRNLPSETPRRRVRLDVIGLALVSPGITAASMASPRWRAVAGSPAAVSWSRSSSAWSSWSPLSRSWCEASEWAWRSSRCSGHPSSACSTRSYSSTPQPRDTDWTAAVSAKPSGGPSPSPPWPHPCASCSPARASLRAPRCVRVLPPPPRVATHQVGRGVAKRRGPVRVAAHKSHSDRSPSKPTTVGSPQ
ncbi:MFS transporter [Streptomyces cellulosae]|uniref:MFS transporter n=1 Tax=Streptomyces cellulosae TaxID=1968 RepID=A0ABW7Y9L8_STRCE